MNGTGFQRWANNLRAGGLYRNGTEGTSGERCSFLEGGTRTCGICYANPVTKTDETKLGQGHPWWYTQIVVEPIRVCRSPAKVRAMNRASAAAFFAFWGVVVIVVPVAYGFFVGWW